MNTQQECPECPDNGNLSWQEPAVIQLCHESEVSGYCDAGTGEKIDCFFGPDAAFRCESGYSFF